MNKYHISVLVILIAIIGYHFCQQPPPMEVPPNVKSSLTASSIKPAEITEPFETLYLGDLAIDIPKSMAIDGQLQFSMRPDAENRNISIGFSDASADEVKNKEYRLTSNEPLERPAGSRVFSWEAAAIKTEDISITVGKPAGLSMFYGPDVEENRWVLGIDARIKEDFGYLEFTFTELISEEISAEQLENVFSQKKDFFSSWLTVFLKAYNWTGHNQKPGPEQVATRLGLLDVKETSLINNIGIAAFFNSIDGTHHPINKMTVMLARTFYAAGICKDSKKLLDYIHDPGLGSIVIYKEWAIPIDSAIYGSLCVTVSAQALIEANDHEAQSYIMGLSNAIVKSVRSAM